MTPLVLVLDIAFVIVAFGVRTFVQVRATGDSGWRVGRPASVSEAVARVSIVGAAVFVGVADATTDGATGPLAIVGVAVAAASIALVFVSQLHMGTSWRIGVDHDEETDLVSNGLFSLIRNPIYTGMATYAVAHCAMTPSPWAVAAVAAMILGVQIQTRLVEEPYLRSLHGATFSAWVARTGRFVPGVGRSVSARG